MEFQLPLAFFGPELVVPVIIFMIPIVAILTSHQRKMAEIYQQRGPQPGFDPTVAMQVDALRREVGELKQLMHQQAIAIDNLAPRLMPPDVTDRLENVSR